MHKVFEPSELELADIQGDPNQVFEIQGKVKELLEANRQRRPVLLDEIRGHGAWALPGVINATYVWMKDLNPKSKQKMMADLMSELAGDNSAASGLLFRAGVLRTPFQIPRAICILALENLDWRPDAKQAGILRREIELADRSGDTQTMLDLYPLLFRLGDGRDQDRAQQLCAQWAESKRAESGVLLRLLVDHFPEQVASIVSDVFSATVHGDDYKDENLARALSHPLRPIPPDWLENEAILNISREVLSRTSSGRHTAIEYLWCDAAADCKKASADRWRQLMPSVSERVKHEASESIARYWYQAVGRAGEIDYLIEQSQSESDPPGGAAALELFFLSRGSRQAKQGLAELQRLNPDRYQDASDRYELIFPRRKIPGVTDEGRKRGELV